MKKTIEIAVGPGERVYIKELECFGIVDQVLIHTRNEFSYKILYFGNGDQKCCWILDSQLRGVKEDE